MKTPENILLIATRRIGDVLMATPLIRSLHRHWPDAEIDVLVYEGTEGCIKSNDDVNRVLTVPERSRILEQLRFLLSIIRRYDVSISVLPGDRPIFYSWIGGKRSYGTVEEGFKQSWKRLILRKFQPFDNEGTHTVLMNLSLADLLGVKRVPEIVVSWSPLEEGRVESLVPFDIDSESYAVIHPYPMYKYKMWHKKGWTEVYEWLVRRGYRVVFTGGPSREETAYIEDILADSSFNALNLSGQLSLGEVGYLLSKSIAYVGPDTAITHMAAALGLPTVALYGPTNPVKWGPWPRDYCSRENPYIRKGSQRQKKVFLLQGQGECVPCHEEGCDRHVDSTSRCMQSMNAFVVINALKDVLQVR